MGIDTKIGIGQKHIIALRVENSINLEIQANLIIQVDGNNSICICSIHLKIQ